VIAGQDDDGFSVIVEDLRGAFEQLDRLSMVIEGVAGQQDDISCRRGGCGQNFGKDRQTIRIAEAVIGAEMQIRAVNDDDFSMRVHPFKFRQVSVDEITKCAAEIKAQWLNRPAVACSIS
jgi:hypothetical protein